MFKIWGYDGAQKLYRAVDLETECSKNRKVHTVRLESPVDNAFEFECYQVIHRNEVKKFNGGLYATRRPEPEAKGH